MDQNNQIQRKLIFSLVCFSFFQVSFLFGQSVGIESIARRVDFCPLLHIDQPNTLLYNQSIDPIILLKPQQMALNNYVDQLSFFCKLEVKTDRKAKMPIRLRLGTVDYVDRLEMKIPGALYTSGLTRNPL